MRDVAARLGFKKVIGKAKKPQFSFQETLKEATEAELLERRHLMKTVATRVYNQMGMSTRVYELSRNTMLWFNQFRESLVDDEERAITDRLAIRLGDLVEEFRRIYDEKIKLADDLEHALTSTKRNLLLGALKKAAEDEMAKNKTEDTEEARKKGVESLWPEEDHPETAAPVVPVDPALILQSAENEIKVAEKAKKVLKRSRKKAVKDEGEKETS
jgi:hypothetical protein